MSQVSEEQLEKWGKEKILKEKNAASKVKSDNIKKNLIVAIVIGFVIFGASKLINKT